jgi:hypothetical protein
MQIMKGVENMAIINSGCVGGNGDFSDQLANHIGETVTLFTSSGGQSGSGFTGVILSVNNVFVRLLTRIGPAPGCSLGNTCAGFNVGSGGYVGAMPGMQGTYEGWMGGPVMPVYENGAMSASGWNGFPVYSVGSITDIPIVSIVSFVHNAT